MDQDRFRETYHQINERACLFEKGILSGLCACSQAKRFCLAEREGVQCSSLADYDHCQDWLTLLREQARFTLGTGEKQGVLPHAKTLKIQVGGLKGLAETLQPEDKSYQAIQDITRLIGMAIDTHGAIDRIPLERIIQQIAAFKGRQRGRKKKSP